MQEMILSQGLRFIYSRDDEETQEEQTRETLKGIDLSVSKGDFIVILGHNGSGKSTFAKMLNALLKPTEGTLWIEGMDSKDDDHLWDIRQKAGMIFQNPDNQMVASIVEEDVAFGPENLGVEPGVIRQRVDQALEAVGMSSYAKGSPAHMSGGQKQRIAIAGILAMKPDMIILDEPTAMLDPRGRAEVMKTLQKLNKEEGITIVHITHYMEEAVLADRIYVIDQGKIALQGTPREVFTQVEKMKDLGLDVPPVTELSYRLQEPEIKQKLEKAGIRIPSDILTVDEFVEAVCPSN